MKTKQVSGVQWIIRADCDGLTMYASGSYPTWTSERAKAEKFDGDDNRQIKLAFFDSIIGLICQNAKCEIEEV